MDHLTPHPLHSRAFTYISRGNALIGHMLGAPPRCLQYIQQGSLLEWDVTRARTVVRSVSRSLSKLLSNSMDLNFSQSGRVDVCLRGICWRLIYEYLPDPISGGVLCTSWKYESEEF
ncbi:hypothetical protein PsAD46_01437 [Pseudovibrio sp. Ad46]|nr:hypothetical protein PsAD46_01437 [Pseudovibrio sp. Ad46]